MDLDNLNLSSNFSLDDLSLEELVNLRKGLTTIKELQDKKLTNSKNTKHKVKIKAKIKQI